MPWYRKQDWKPQIGLFGYWPQRNEHNNYETMEQKVVYDFSKDLVDESRTISPIDTMSERSELGERKNTITERSSNWGELYANHRALFGKPASYRSTSQLL